MDDFTKRIDEGFGHQEELFKSLRDESKDLNKEVVSLIKTNATRIEQAEKRITFFETVFKVTKWFAVTIGALLVYNYDNLFKIITKLGI